MSQIAALHRVLDWLDVYRDFGADPAGVRDSTALIQLALNEGGRIYIPPGRYKISAPLKITLSGTEIVGAGKNSVLFSALDTLQFGFAVVTGAQYVRFADFALLGEAAGEVIGIAGAGAIGINTNAAADGWAGLDQLGHVAVDRVYFGGNTAAKGWCQGISNNRSGYLRVQNCTFDGIVGESATYGYGITASGKYHVITDNHFISPLGGGRGRHAVYVNYDASFCRVSRNYCLNYDHAAYVLSHSVVASGGFGNIFSDNVAEGCNTQEIDGMAVILIATTDVVALPGGGCVISGNHLKSCFGTQIRVQGNPGSTVIGNSATDIQGYGAPAFVNRAIKLESTPGTTVKGNTLSGIPANAQDGVWVTLSNGAVIFGNDISGAGLLSGIRLNAAPPEVAGCIVEGNSISGATASVVDETAGKTNVIAVNKAVTFAVLSAWTPGNGTTVYCTDADPVPVGGGPVVTGSAGAKTGAMVCRVNGAWRSFA